MTRLPQISGRDLVKALESLGYEQVRQRGSHIRLIHKNSNLPPITIPDHKVIGKGLLRKILRDASLSQDELRMLV